MKTFDNKVITFIAQIAEKIYLSSSSIHFDYIYIYIFFFGWGIGSLFDSHDKHIKFQLKIYIFTNG